MLHSRQEASILGLLFLLVAYSDGKGLLQNSVASLCLQSAGGSTQNGASMSLETCNFATRAQWINIQNWEDYARNGGPIILEVSGKCLTLKNGMIVLQYDCSGVETQHWTVFNTASDGSVQLRNGPLCLSREGSGSTVTMVLCGERETSKSELPATYWNKLVFPKAGGSGSGAGLGGLVSQSNGKCLAVPSGSSVLKTVTCDLSNSRHLWNVLEWEITPNTGTPPPNFWVKNSAISGRAMATSSTSPSQNGDVVQLVTQGSLNTPPAQQQWYFVLDSRGILMSKLHPGQCLTVTGSSTADNAPLSLTPCDLTQSNQLLNVQDLSIFTEIDRGNLMFSHSHKCLTVNNAGLNDGELVEQLTCAEAPEQKWSLINKNTREGGGAFQLQNKLSSLLCLTVTTGGTIVQSACGDYSSTVLGSYWETIEKPSADIFSIVNANSPPGTPKCLTMENNGNDADLQDCVGSNNQLWTRKLSAYDAKAQGSSCTKDINCMSNDCVLPILGLGTCAESEPGFGCSKNSDCKQDLCQDGICRCTKYVGDSCLHDSDCCSRHCNLLSGAGLLKCGCSPVDADCRSNDDCCTNKCDLGVPAMGFKGTQKCVYKVAGETCEMSNCPFDMSVGDECASGTCSSGLCTQAANGKYCKFPNDDECVSGHYCRPGNVCGTNAPADGECSTDSDCTSSIGSGFVCRGGVCCKGAGAASGCDANGVSNDDGSYPAPGCCSGKCYTSGRQCSGGAWTPNCFKGGPTCA